MKRRKSDQGIADYVHTGGFNRLAGRPTAPGSWRPERSAFRWKIFLFISGMLFLLTGMFFVVF